MIQLKIVTATFFQHLFQHCSRKFNIVEEDRMIVINFVFLLVQEQNVILRSHYAQILSLLAL